MTGKFKDLSVMKITQFALSSLIAPVVLIGAFLFIFVIFLLRINSNSENEQKEDVYIISERVTKNIELKLKGNLDFIKLLALERADNKLSMEAFQRQVSLYLKDHPEFINITWIDSSFQIKTVCPLEGNAYIIGLRIELPEPKRVSRLARELKNSHYTKPFEAIQSNSSFEVWVPVFKNNKFLGLFAGVYSCERLLKQSIPHEKYNKANISLIDEAAIVHAEYSPINLNKNIITHQKPLLTLKNGMRVKVETIKETPFSLDMVILITLCILLLLSLAFSLSKIRREILLRKQIQDTLKTNENILHEQNEKYLIINEELKDKNNSIQKINEELLTAKERAEESDRLKTAFLQNMSHEIRTPMNAIVGFSELLENNYTNSAKIEKYSKIIRQRSNDLLDIINDILDIAKIESGQLTLNIEECNVEDLFTELTLFFSEYQKRIGKQHISFTLQTPDTLSNVLILTDKVKLKQILINLISNAFKFTEEGKIEGGYSFDGSSLITFYISDTGVGIPADKHDKVFERFAQLDNTHKQAAGTGLGLSIVKGLVKLLGGKISLISETGKGSTFTFVFPVEWKNKSNQ